MASYLLLCYAVIAYDTFANSTTLLRGVFVVLTLLHDIRDVRQLNDTAVSSLPQRLTSAVITSSTQ